jgi:hypothetical protein
MKYQNKSQLLSLALLLSSSSSSSHPYPSHNMKTIFSPSISCLNEAKPGTVDQNVMQSVDLPLLDSGPSDAMSSLVTAVIKIDRLIRKASSSYMVRMT